jgi:hypothetical protein
MPLTALDLPYMGLTPYGKIVQDRRRLGMVSGSMSPLVQGNGLGVVKSGLAAAFEKACL